MDDFRKRHLADFVAWARQNVTGDEKGQSQIFLDRLFQAFGQRGCLDVGGQTEFRIRKSADDGGGTAFADYVWKPVVLIEMKKRGEPLARHYRQAFDYWTRLAPGRPRYVVLSNFDEFWVYDFNSAQMDTPVDTVALDDLPERYGPLAFLFPTQEKPVFNNNHEQVTRAAADLLAECFNKLVTRRVDRQLAQRFILQMLVALFAEDIGLLPKYILNRLLEECNKKPSDSFDLLGGLFTQMNDPAPAAGGRFKGVEYFNGGIFADPARVELCADELAQLARAAEADWSKVRPEIFGTLFEHSLDQGRRHAFGAHFTSPVDIMKIVGPTIVEPWRDRIENATKRKELGGILERMCAFTVLDSACGSGNFLYIAYRELKRLEAIVWERLAEKSGRDPSQRALGFVTARQFYGIDINPFAVELAKVAMMIARKLAIEELHVTEPALPLDNLDKNFITGDALIDAAGNPVAWPKTDVIIGNPPFLDARKMTVAYGRETVANLERVYPQVPRRADLCVYWFRKAQDHLPACTAENPFAGRAGLVGTQNIRNNESREGGLDYVVAGGTIIDAVDNQPWSGEANVHVSIVNWVKTKDPALLPKTRKIWSKVTPPAGTKKLRKRGTGPASKEFEVAARECRHINAALSDQTDVIGAIRLRCNFVPKVAFEGQQPGHMGFRISPDTRREVAAKEPIEEVTFPYINAIDFVTNSWVASPSFIIDFGDRDVLAASAYPRTLQIVRKNVLPDWQKNAEGERRATATSSGEHQGRLSTWWQLKRPRQQLLTSLARLTRFVVCPRVTKRPVFAFLSTKWRPDSSLSCFAFADDYSFGILQSSAHWQWFVTKCSKLTERFRYTPESVFDTFPWPQGSTARQVEAVAAAGREVRRVRAAALANLRGGLRALYRTLELPGKNPLKDAHAALDAAVMAAYGFAPGADLLAQLLALNLDVAARIDAGQGVTAPGVPPTYPNPAALVSDDCIQP